MREPRMFVNLIPRVGQDQSRLRKPLQRRAVVVDESGVVALPERSEA